MKYFSDKGMMLAISGISTNYGSQLDCVFTKNVICSCNYYESLNPISTVDNHDILPHDSHSTSMTGQQSYPDHIADVYPIPTDNISTVDADIIIGQVYIPTPIVPPISTGNNANTFTYAMRQSLAQCINLQRIPIRPTNFTGCRVTSTDYYDFMHANVRDRFNFRIVPITGDGNCFFRTLSHIIFGDESEHHNIRGSIIDTFEQSPYVAALCGIQGYNAVTIQQHFNNMRRNYS